MRLFFLFFCVEADENEPFVFFCVVQADLGMSLFFFFFFVEA